jgi:hypothetical protein
VGFDPKYERDIINGSVWNASNNFQ